VLPEFSHAWLDEYLAPIDQLATSSFRDFDLVDEFSQSPID
jgi:hypothetical protein